MTNIWLERSKENLKKLSKNQTNFKTMLAEWYYNGDSYDLQVPCEECQLCGYREIRYQFTIQNRFTGNEIFVGSECITRFDLSGIGEYGEYLSSEQTQKKVKKDRQNLIKQARFKRVLNCLIQLSQKQPSLKIEDTIEKFQNRGSFSPKHILFLFWKLKENKVLYNPKDFKVSLRRQREKDQMDDLKDWQIKDLLPCLSSAQKNMLGL